MQEVHNRVGITREHTRKSTQKAANARGPRARRDPRIRVRYFVERCAFFGPVSNRPQVIGVILSPS